MLIYNKLYFKQFKSKLKIKAKSAKISKTIFKVKIQQWKKECSIGNLLNPKIDYVFKRIFGHVGNEEITIVIIHKKFEI